MKTARWVIGPFVLLTSILLICGDLSLMTVLTSHLRQPIPEYDGSIEARTGQVLAIWTEGHIDDAARVTGQFHQQVTRIGIPNDGQAVIAGRRKISAGRIKGDVVHRPRVPVECEQVAAIWRPAGGVSCANTEL